MNRILRAAATLGLACACALGALDAHAQKNGENGAPPGNNATGDSASGKSAGYAGGAGAAGQSGTDPATLSRTEEQRLQKKNGQAAHGASGPKATGARKDWKE